MGCNDHIWKLELEPAQKLVLLALLDNPDSEGWSDVSLDYVAWRTGYYRTHAVRIVKKLAEDGILEVSKRTGRTSLYRLDEDNVTTQEAYQSGISRRSQDSTGRKIAPLTSATDSTASGRKIAPNSSNSYIDSVPGFESAQLAATKYKINDMSDSALAAACEKHGGKIVEDAMQIAAMKDKHNWLYVVGIMENFEKRIEKSNGGHAKVTYEGWTPHFVEPGAEQNLRIVEEMMQQQKDAANA